MRWQCELFSENGLIVTQLRSKIVGSVDIRASWGRNLRSINVVISPSFRFRPPYSNPLINMAVKSSLPSVEAHARQTVQTLFSYLEAQGRGDYIGEAISQLEHSLQTAALAKDAGSDDETVIAALLHDVGRFIPRAKDMPKMIAPDGTFVGTESHEVTAEKYLRSLRFSEKVCSIVGAHVWAKRYLCATEDGYWESLSKSSKVTLEFQVGYFII